MGDDCGYSINDLPKVSKIVSSEQISKSKAFDFMIRFLKANDHSSGSNAGLAESSMEVSNEHNDIGAFSSIYHCWEDLFHVTETLASRRPGVSLDSDPQQVALRNLRLGVTLKTEDGLEAQDSRSSEALNGAPSAGNQDESPRKRSKKEKSEKKEKKRKRGR
jgi:hypothetical protein